MRKIAVLLAGLTALAPVGSASALDRVIDNWEPPTRDVAIEDIAASRPHLNKLKVPGRDRLRAMKSRKGAEGLVEDADTFETRAYGAFAMPYSATRVQQGRSKYTSKLGPSYLSTTYPYRTVGRLTFTVGGWTSYCTASVIRRGIILTAAHCVQDFGAGSTTFRDWAFTPGFYGAGNAAGSKSAPYGVWKWRSFVRPTTWANGTDIGIGAARDNDLALIALRPNRQGKLIGDVVGKLGYAWNNYSFVESPLAPDLYVGAVSTLGYPVILDGGNIMQRADGPAFLADIGGAGQILQGSNFAAGSSGGPFVVNLRSRNAKLSGGAVPGAYSRLAVIGVMSWGSIDPNDPKDGFSSQFRQNPAYPLADYGGYGAGNIGALMYALCSKKPKGSTKTFAQLGYCK